MASRITWEYLAGFLDGEGCFKIYGYAPRVTVAQKDREVIDLIKEFLGIENAITKSGPAGVHYLQINSKAHVRYVIEGVMPYLIVKKKDAQAILDFWDRNKRGI